MCLLAIYLFPAVDIEALPLLVFKGHFISSLPVFCMHVPMLFRSDYRIQVHLILDISFILLCSMNRKSELIWLEFLYVHSWLNLKSSSI